MTSTQVTEPECKPYGNNIADNFTCVCDGKNVTTTSKGDIQIDIEGSIGDLPNISLYIK